MLLVAWQLLAAAASLAAQEKGKQAAVPGIPLVDPEVLAVEFLAREVPQWSRQNGCFSCHNNGDAARGLFAAARAGVKFNASAYDETVAFLSMPNRWDSNGPDGPFNDRKLARLQFAAALAAAYQAGLVRDRVVLVAAGDMLLADQIPNGSWEFVGADEIGSPVTYGRPLATALAVRILRLADLQRFAPQIAAADTWLKDADPKSVLNAAAVLLGIGKSRDAEAGKQRERCLAILRRGEATEGGWGPYITAAPEPFDTAVVLCALAEAEPSGWSDSIRRGRQYLIRCQLSDGSWPETTRPAERESYAQRLSTAGWATTALLATRIAEP